MSFLFDKLFQKQNPELAGQMAKRGLIFDRIRHRWVRKPENRANPSTIVKKWKVGGRITHEDTLYSAPMGIGTNSIVVLPETTEGMASVAAVDEIGVIQAWFMRNEPVKEAMDYAKNNPRNTNMKREFLEAASPKWKRGDKVQIPHRGKMTAGTIVRYDGGEYYKGEKVGSSFYVVDVGEYESVKVPSTNVRG